GGLAGAGSRHAGRRDPRVGTPVVQLGTLEIAFPAATTGNEDQPVVEVGGGVSSPRGRHARNSHGRWRGRLGREWRGAHPCGESGEGECACRKRAAMKQTRPRLDPHWPLSYSALAAPSNPVGTIHDAIR